MSAKLVQRGIVVMLVLATVAAAIVAHLVPRNGLERQRSDRVSEARHRIGDALRRRAFFLEDVADMVGVHDDAAADEFSRYAHVRGRYEHAVVAVQWLRRSPEGKLVPPAETGPNPVLIPPASDADTAVADAAQRPAAAPAFRLASRSKRVAISGPVRLANGHSAFYLAVPVQAHRFTGLLSKVESHSAVVGLVDAQALVAQELSARPLGALRLRDAVTPLASIGSSLHNAVDVSVPAAGRNWTLSVDGGSLSTLERLLPWLILATGLGLSLTVGLVLRQSIRRRDMALRLAEERYDELEQARSQAERLSRVDALTDVYNRRHFTEVLAGELSRVRRGGEPPAVLMLDIDHFKRVNDEHGHLTGDAVLRASAYRIASILRGSDTLARWGGEEFAILAPATDAEGATRLAERARAALAARPVEVEGVSLDLTASIGVAVAADGSVTPDALVDAADQVLYDAKRAGRDCVRLSDLSGRQPDLV
jgi:diguanylate cyclase (GGDEF)-like protein